MLKFLTHHTSRVRQRLGTSAVQAAYLDTLQVEMADHISVILVPKAREVRGGTLQLLSMRHALAAVLPRSQVALLCWTPNSGVGHSHLIDHGDLTPIARLPMVSERARDGATIVVHVPEFAAAMCADHPDLTALASRHRVHINVLNLNHNVLPGRSTFNQLMRLFPRVTMTADIWATTAYQEVCGVDVHWIPVWFWPHDISPTSYQEKRDILLVSPDGKHNPAREQVLTRLRERHPRLSMIEITRMPFDQYCRLEQVAKWSITFGEGHDGYFMGPAMRGGIPFAVFNDTFVGWDPSEWQTLYSDYDAMLHRISDDLAGLDSEPAYSAYSQRLQPRYRTRGVFDVMKRQLRRFNDGTFDYYPGPNWRPSSLLGPG
jgi:hypothetical protein